MNRHNFVLWIRSSIKVYFHFVNHDYKLKFLQPCQLYAFWSDQKDMYAAPETKSFIEDLMKTPKRSTSRNVANNADSSFGSPQCRVGWDDGSDSNLSMSASFLKYFFSLFHWARFVLNMITDLQAWKVQFISRLSNGRLDAVQMNFTNVRVNKSYRKNRGIRKTTVMIFQNVLRGQKIYRIYH